MATQYSEKLVLTTVVKVLHSKAADIFDKCLYLLILQQCFVTIIVYVHHVLHKTTKRHKKLICNPKFYKRFYRQVDSHRIWSLTVFFCQPTILVDFICIFCELPWLPFDYLPHFVAIISVVVVGYFLLVVHASSLYGIRKAQGLIGESFHGFLH